MKRKAKYQYYGSLEGLQEEKYFQRLQTLINTCDETKFQVNFNFVNVKGGSALSIAKKAKRFLAFDASPTVVSVFDYDFNDDFSDAIKYCCDNSIMEGYSNVNFELWLILHKKEYRKIISDSKGYTNVVKSVYGLNKDVNIKSEDVIEKILNQIELSDVINAIELAKKLEQQQMNTGELFDKVDGHYTQPFIKLHEFIEKVLTDVEIINKVDINLR